MNGPLILSRFNAVQKGAAGMKAAGNHVIYFAGYKRPSDQFKRRAIEDACDIVVWSVDEGPAIPTHRPQDRTTIGNIVQAMERYARGELGEVSVRLEDVDRLVAEVLREL